MAHDVFISYSSRDKAVADSMCATLESRKIRCWIAPRDVPAGRSWPDALIEAIGKSRVFILILSKGSNTSQQVLREVGEAMEKGIPAIPFRIDDVEPSREMRYYIRGIHWLDAITPPLERHLQILADTVQGLLTPEGIKRQPASPPPEESIETVVPGKPTSRPLRLSWIQALGLAILMCCGFGIGGVGIYLAAQGVIKGTSGSLLGLFTPSPIAEIASAAPTDFPVSPNIAPAFPTDTPSSAAAFAGPSETAVPTGRSWQNWTLIKSFPSPGDEPTGIVRVGDNLWVNVPCSNRIYRLDLAGNLVAELEMPEPGCGPRDVGLAWDGTALWGTWWNKVIKIDPDTGQKLSEFNIDLESCSITWDGSSLWVVDRQGNLSAYDPDGRRLRRLAIPVFGVVSAITWANGEFWMLDEFGKVTRFNDDFLDVGSFSLSSTCGISSFHEQKSFGMYWDDMNLWVADAVENRIYQCAPGD
jgi:hypothetical protein